MKSCCFVANGNDTIGMGHIMRCIAIADILKSTMDIFFISKYTEGIEFLKSKGYNVIEYNKLNGLYDFIVIDSYEISYKFFEFFKSYTKKLVYIDDLNLFDYNVDIVINTSITANIIDYKLSSTKKYLLGSDYCILRKEFRDIERKALNKKVNNILITTGGSDSHNMTFNLLKFMVDKFDMLKYNVIIGQAFKNTDTLVKLASQNSNITIYKSPSNMAYIMMKCDLAISASGNTLYELCCCGIPTISFILADNQIKFVKGFEEKGCIKNIGMWDKIDYNYFYRLICKYISNYDFRKNMRDNQLKLVDGKGVYRIIDSLE